MNPQFRKTYRAAADRIAEDLTGLLGEEITLDRRGAETGLEHLRTFPNYVYRCGSQRMNDAAEPAGFIFGEDLAARLGGVLLMMPGEDHGMTEEIAEAFDEIVNIVTGSWKTAAPVEDRLSNDVSVRDVTRMDVEEFEEWLQENGLNVVVAPMTLDGQTSSFGFFGPKDWIGSAPVEAPAPAPEPEKPKGPALDVPAGKSPSWGGAELGSTSTGSSSPGFGGGAELGSTSSEASAPSEAAQAPATDAGGSNEDLGAALAASSGRHAVMMVIDKSGELNEWLIRHMEEGSLRFIKPGPNREELDERSTVIVLGPDSELFRKLRVDKCVVAEKLPE